MATEYIIGKGINTSELSNIAVIIDAYAEQLGDLSAAIETLKRTRSLSDCTGEMLDKAGEIVGLKRHDAGVMISNASLVDNDDVYRMLLQYKALINSSECTVDDIMSACRILFNAVDVRYSEVPTVPATFWVSITAPFNETILSLLSSHNIMIRASGVTARIACSDTQYFGFADCDPGSLGFGEGKFAQSIM